MNNGQLLLSFQLNFSIEGSKRGDPSSPFTYLWLLPSNRIKVIIIRKEITVVNKEYQCFSYTTKDLKHTVPYFTRPYDKCSGPKPINTKKTPIGLIGVVLITIKKP